MRFGFVIDQRKCIGCHACTVACKEENQVPLGAFRTWVKYVERGAFPSTRRYFSVLRCNHCDAAPCVTICPTVALHRRPDGIVDLDGARCIGCKSCMQACPYDALYIDPDTHTAAKCHYCAHRVEVGLAPACVIVCPEQAIVAGDLDDPASPVARLVAREQVQVRKPEQGTRPKVFYLGADTAALSPELQTAGERFMWGERPSAEASLVRMVAGLHDGDGWPEGARARTVYDVPHMPRPWGGKVSSYLWTKSVAAGAGLLTAGASGLLAAAGAAISLLFLALTAALLVLDLKRPDRFLYILLKPNRRSWLVWGAWILIAFGIVETLVLAGALRGSPPGMALATAAVLLAVATAGYSAFLFGQAEGRDFWQSPLKLPHLVVAAIAAGSAALLLVAPGWTGSGLAFGRPEIALHDDRGTPASTLAPILLGTLVIHALLIGAELFSRHAGHDAALAARLLRRGALAPRLWGGALGVGVLLPLVLVFLGAGTESAALTAAGAVLSLVGLWIYEDAWVKAGQSVPLS